MSGVLPPAGSACVPWPVDMSSCKGWAADPGEWTPGQLSAVLRASETLWRLTAGMYGVCLAKVRPCRKSPCGMLEAGGETYVTGYAGGAGGMVPYMYGGEVYNLACGAGCGNDCSCTSVCSVELPGPAQEIVEVMLDGQVLAPEGYRLSADRRTLWRITPEGQQEQCWPLCQALHLPDTEDGTWSVTYHRGHPIREGSLAAHAAATLACEMWKRETGAANCQLPERVTTVQREGLTYTLIDPLDFLKEGRTGIASVDMWLSMVNPAGLKSRPQVWSPDLPQARTDWIAEGRP